MKILLTGANGYIGRRLLLSLIREGHHVTCCVRDKNRFTVPEAIREQVEVLEVDFSKNIVDVIPQDVEAAYYLMHSMSSSSDYRQLELDVAQNFIAAVEATGIKQVIYLSGIANEEQLSTHLESRLAVENKLKEGDFHLTTLRAGIIIGSGSASFEIIRDLVEKLPVMITPKWLLTRCQPIAIGDVMKFLTKSLMNEATYDQSFDIGGRDVLTYKEMLMGYAQVRKLARYIMVVPVMTPKLSSYWLYFVTTTSYKLASALVSSMKIEVICRDRKLAEILKIETMNYKEALHLAFSKIESNQIISSWKDSLVSGRFKQNISEFLEVPTFGCFKDDRKRMIASKARCVGKIWKIGGSNGWYYGNWMWKLRGFMDRLAGGVGLRRGRTSAIHISAGDAIDFWRVLYANSAEGRLLLFAEMKLPGEAWLEFKVEGSDLRQTATFRPHGVWGRIYWYSVLPFHGFIFNGMLKKLTN